MSSETTNIPVDNESKKRPGRKPMTAAERETAAKARAEEKVNRDNQYLNEEQADLLRRLRDQLEGEERDTINSILVQLLPPHLDK